MEGEKMCWCDGFVAGWVCLKPVGFLFEACWLPQQACWLWEEACWL